MFTLEHLNTLVDTVKLAAKECEKYQNLKIDISGSDLFLYFERAINILLESYFGIYNTNLIWEYIYGNSKFDTTKELYDYLMDEHSELVCNSPLTVNQLIEKFPKDKMFKLFKQIIDEQRS